MTGTEKLARVLYATAKVLCVVGGVCCLGIALGAAGAVDCAGPGEVRGAVLQFVGGIAGMCAFIGINGLLDR